GHQEVLLVDVRTRGGSGHVVNTWDGRRAVLSDGVDAVRIPVEVGGALEGRAVGLHPVTCRAGVHTRDVEEDDGGEHAQDCDDDEQLDEGESTLVTMRACARIFEYGEKHILSFTSLDSVERRGVILRDL